MFSFFCFTSSVPVHKVRADFFQPVFMQNAESIEINLPSITCRSLSLPLLAASSLSCCSSVLSVP